MSENVTVEQLEQELVEQGHELESERASAAMLTEELKTAKAKFDEEHAALIKYEKERRAKVEQREIALREKMLAYHQISGSKRFQEAFEIRLLPTAEYDPDKLKLWVLDAPRGLQTELLTLDTKKVVQWLKDHATDQGAILPIAFCEPTPALIVNKPTAAILSKGLPDLKPTPKIVQQAVPLPTIITTEANPPLVLTAPAAAIKLDEPPPF